MPDFVQIWTPSTSQLLSILRRCALGHMKALLLVSQKTPGNKSEIELAHSYALLTVLHGQKSTEFESILLEIEPVTS